MHTNESTMSYTTKVFNDDDKYNYLIGFWVREDVSDFYKMNRSKCEKLQLSTQILRKQGQRFNRNIR